ncbi:MAG: glycosyltransferase family A protein [Candidatus Doudnabacteria bacterium]|jgi:hypothetical protein
MVMLKTCKLAVLIPIFNETSEMILRPLESLAEQEGVGFQNFEVVFIVNNSKAEALNKAPAFLVNQQALQILRFVGDPDATALPGEAEVHRERLKKIRDRGLQVRVIDKSSEKNAEIQNTVGRARQIVGEEAAKSFLSETFIKENGILVSTDCDCSFSHNYVSGIINSFANYELISLSGNLKLEGDPGQNFSNDVLTATKLHLNWHLIKPIKQQISFYNRDDGEDLNRLVTVNIAVAVKTWLAVGGTPSMHSLEDLFFCKKIFALPGSFAKSPEFTVSILNRISHRAGALSLGRRVGVINSAVESFKQGQASKLMVPDIFWLSRFYLMLMRAIELKSLDVSLLKWLMENNQFQNLHEVNAEDLALITNTVKKMTQNQKQLNYVAIEGLIVKHLFAFLPQKDITLEFAKQPGFVLDNV